MADVSILDKNRYPLTSTSEPFWLEGQTLKFRNSSEADSGIYSFLTIGVTIYVESDETIDLILEELSPAEEELLQSLTVVSTDVSRPVSEFFSLGISE